MKEINYYCDRCGKKIQGSVLHISLIKVLNLDESPDFNDFNLCKSCLNHFYNFMNKRILSYNDIVRED